MLTRKKPEQKAVFVISCLTLVIQTYVTGNNYFISNGTYLS